MEKVGHHMPGRPKNSLPNRSLSLGTGRGILSVPVSRRHSHFVENLTANAQHSPSSPNHKNS
jgi:hypothetical protein